MLIKNIISNKNDFVTNTGVKAFHSVYNTEEENLAYHKRVLERIEELNR